MGRAHCRPDESRRPLRDCPPSGAGGLGEEARVRKRLSGSRLAAFPTASHAFFARARCSKLGLYSVASRVHKSFASLRMTVSAEYNSPQPAGYAGLRANPAITAARFSTDNRQMIPSEITQ